MSEAPRLSVVVPTFRRPDLLQRCLGALLAQRMDASAYEIVVADDGCEDRIRELVQAMQPASGHPAIRYVCPQTHGPAAARNAGWRAARGALIAFTDDDTVPDRYWLAEGERCMTRELCAAAGRVRVPVTDPRPTDHELMTLGLESAEFVTANAFVWRDALERVGGFDEGFKRAWREDSDLQFRLMHHVGPVGRIESAVVVHPVRPERWGVCLRQQKNAWFDALLYKKHPRLYRERIDASPPWSYFAIVGLSLGALAAPMLGEAKAGLLCLAGAAALVLRLAFKRLRRTSWRPAHVWEMLATSAAIPFLSVYWRLRGAWHYRVFFL
jgi:glycosyltransferase involved in cell wall biosynthesis